MKKTFVILISLLCLACLPVSGAFAGSEVLHHPPLQIEIPKATVGVSPFAFQVVDQNGYRRFEIDWSGGTSQWGATGTQNAYNPSDRVVYITSYSQLSTWTGQAATSGQSYFQTEPGKIYIVDPHAIATSRNTAGYGATGGTSGAMGGAFTGVSAILPDASTYSGPAYDVTVMLLTTGATGYAVAETGSTNIQVWPYPGSGATSYNANGTRKPQSILRVYGYNGDTSGTTGVVSGASYWEIDKTGENTVFGLYNSSVSAFPKQRNIRN